jgi:hypothetical protein
VPHATPNEAMGRQQASSKTLFLSFFLKNRESLNAEKTSIWKGSEQSKTCSVRRLAMYGLLFTATAGMGVYKKKIIQKDKPITKVSNKVLFLHPKIQT